MIAIVQVTFPDLPTAERIARVVIDERVAACANLLPCTSLYRWQGAVEHGSEVLGQFKTNLVRADALVNRLKALHPYEQPAVEWWRVDADASVADWIEAEVS